jgi:hypothetical protein
METVASFGGVADDPRGVKISFWFMSTPDKPTTPRRIFHVQASPSIRVKLCEPRSDMPSAEPRRKTLTNARQQNLHPLIWQGWCHLGLRREKTTGLQIKTDDAY